MLVFVLWLLCFAARAPTPKLCHRMGTYPEGFRYTRQNAFSTNAFVVDSESGCTCSGLRLLTCRALKCLTYRCCQYEVV